MAKQRYCRKVSDSYVYAYSDALMARSDFVECDAEGRRMDVTPPEPKQEGVAGIEPEAPKVSELDELIAELREKSKAELQEWSDENLGGFELNLRQEHAKVVDDCVKAYEEKKSREPEPADDGMQADPAADDAGPANEQENMENPDS